MFEYAVSASEGTLLDYGVCDHGGMKGISDYVDFPDFVFNGNGDCIMLDALYSVAFRAASPDCVTGQ